MKCEKAASEEKMEAMACIRLEICLIVLFVVYNNVSCMEDGTSYIIRPGKIDCFHRELKRGTNLDFEMEVKKRPK